MSGHIIVCGMGDVGYRITELLHRLGETVVVVTQEARDERRLAAADRGVRVLLGDARSERLLLEAGLASARAVIAATGNDLVNIEVALDAQRCHPGIAVVLRLFDQDLARQLESSFDIRRALGMSALSAPSFATAALGGSVLASFTVSDIPFVVGRQPAGGRPLHRCPDVDTVSRLYHLRPLLRERPDASCVPLPGPDEPLQREDRLTLLARKSDWDHLFGSRDKPVRPPGKPPLLHSLRQLPPRALRLWRDEPLPLRVLFLSLCLLIPVIILFFRFHLGITLTDAIFYTMLSLHGEIGLTETLPEIKLTEVGVMILGSVTLATLYSLITDSLLNSRLRKLLGGQPMPKGGHVIVVGMGHVGYRILRELLAIGVPAVAVEGNPDAALLGNVRTVAPVVLGDAHSSDILAQAGIATARAVVAATGDDAVNLSIGLAAKRQNPRIRTAIRLFDAEFARKVESALGIDAAMSPSRIAAPTFAASALYPDVVKAVIVQDQFLVLLERKAGDWAGMSPSGLKASQGIDLLLRNGAFAIGEAPLDAEDRVLGALCRGLAPAWAEQAVKE